MREIEYGKLADEVKNLQSDMRRLEFTAVAVVGAVSAFLLTEKYGKDFLLLGSLIPFLVTLSAGLRYITYYYQLKRIQEYLRKKEIEDGYDGWEQFVQGSKKSIASRLSIISSLAFWLMLLLFSLAFIAAVLAYD